MHVAAKVAGKAAVAFAIDAMASVTVDAGDSGEPVREAQALHGVRVVASAKHPNAAAAFTTHPNAAFTAAKHPIAAGALARYAKAVEASAKHAIATLAVATHRIAAGAVATHPNAAGRRVAGADGRTHSGGTGDSQYRVVRGGPDTNLA